MTHLTDPRTQQVKQLRLFETTNEEQPSLASDNGSSYFNDPSFASNKTQPVHRWVPWIAGFSSDFVSDVLNKYLISDGVVLDPFAGVGTTLVEAILHGHSVVGFEINPYAALACRTKVNAYRIDGESLCNEMLRFQTFYKEKISENYIPNSTPPKGFKTRSTFYSPKVLRKVLILQDFIGTIEEPNLQELFKLAFASTMVRYSNYSYEPSLGRRASAGKPDIEDFPVGQTILDKLSEMAQDISWLQQNLADRHPNVRIIIETPAHIYTGWDMQGVHKT